MEITFKQTPIKKKYKILFQKPMEISNFAPTSN